MKKTVDKDTAGHSEGFFNPDLLFCNDAAVVDYLNALLETEPALNMDFREIHFVHQEKTLNSNTNMVVGNMMQFNAEISKTEADLLRSENENLKFKTELAEIDAQVLRTENNKLKIVKERLIAQLFEMKEKLNTMRAENALMRKNAEADHHQLVQPAITVEDKIENVPTDSPSCAEMVVYEKADSEPEQTVQCEIPVEELQPEPVAVVEECRNDDKNSISIDQERLSISRVTVQNDGATKMTSSDMTFFSRESAGGVSRQDAQQFSKVIKHHPVEKNHHRPTGHIVKAVSPDEMPREKNYEAAKRLNFVPQHSIPEIENSPEAEAPAPLTAVEPFKDVDEFDMPPAPDPKVVIRRNVKNYEDLQNESDAKKTLEAGHTLIL